jgi:hypothetical protein
MRWICQGPHQITSVPCALDNLEGIAARCGVQPDDIVEAHDAEERLRVHALRRAEVCASLLEEVHRVADAVVRCHTRDERED